MMHPGSARSSDRSWALGVCALLVLAGAPPRADAQVFLSQEEALKIAFPPPATIERETAFLGEEQLARARALAGSDVRLGQRVVTYYVGWRDGQPVGIAYFDAHRVRTMREVAMILVLPDGTIDRVEVLSFLEPPEYMASEPWIEQLVGQGLTDDLAVNRGIINLTGATLTAGALTRAARRILALHEVIRPLELLGEDGEG